jgi:hypothetical protein
MRPLQVRISAFAVPMPMLIASVVAAIFVSSCDAFLLTPSPTHLQDHLCLWKPVALVKSSFQLYGNSKNIRAAMEATERYGVDSPEARLAWEVVEEFDARSKDSAAYTPNENNRLSEEQMANAYAELQHTLQMMERRKMTFQQNDQLMKDVASELQAIKLAPPNKKPAPKIPGLWDATLKARAMSQQFGNSSTEAKLAWEEVEEIASAGLENAMGDSWTDQTCDLAQAAEACMALEELERFIYLENQNMSDGIGMNPPY